MHFSIKKLLSMALKTNKHTTIANIVIRLLLNASNKFENAELDEFSISNISHRPEICTSGEHHGSGCSVLKIIKLVEISVFCVFTR